MAGPPPELVGPCPGLNSEGRSSSNGNVPPEARPLRAVARSVCRTAYRAAAGSRAAGDDRRQGPGGAVVFGGEVAAGGDVVATGADVEFGAEVVTGGVVAFGLDVVAVVAAGAAGADVAAVADEFGAAVVVVDEVVDEVVDVEFGFGLLNGGVRSFFE